MLTLGMNGRIQIFAKTNAVQGATFHALRMVGNLGSHGTGITREAVLDALELYEHVLAEIFAKKSKKLADIQKKILQSKGKYKL